MKTLTAIVLAGSMALTSLTGATTAASADWKKRYGDEDWQKRSAIIEYYRNDRHGPPHHRHWRDHDRDWRDHDRDWGPGIGFAAGSIFGLSLGVIATSPRTYYRPAPPPPYPGLSRTEAHIEWCLDRYRSYNPATDRFLGYDGYYHRCVSPF